MRAVRATGVLVSSRDGVQRYLSHAARTLYLILNEVCCILLNKNRPR